LPSVRELCGESTTDRGATATGRDPLYRLSSTARDAVTKVLRVVPRTSPVGASEEHPRKMTFIFGEQTAQKRRASKTLVFFGLSCYTTSTGGLNGLGSPFGIET